MITEPRCSIHAATEQDKSPTTVVEVNSALSALCQRAVPNYLQQALKINKTALLNCSIKINLRCARALHQRLYLFITNLHTVLITRKHNEQNKSEKAASFN